MRSRFRFCAVRSLVALLAIPLVVQAAEAPASAPAGALRIYGNTTTIELAPVLLAAKTHGEPVTISNGGVPNLFRPGEAELSTNAETQALRTSVANPDLRIILTVSEGLYRIVGRRSAGIDSLADLKGKRIATIPVTSSGYFLHRMLRTVGLDYDDVTAVPMLPLSRMVDALEKGEVDAVTIWEPEMENARQRLGDDAIEFSGHGVYREIFNLNTTAQQLADPVQRRRIVEFVRSILRATKALHEDPREAWQLVAKSGGLYDVPLIARTWHHHGYPGIIVPDLLDVLEDEEKYVAREGGGRAPRSRAELARLIDDSVLKEALEGHPELRISRPDPHQVRDQVLRMRVSRLQSTVDQAAALRDVKRVQHALNHYREAGRWRDAAALFTRDARARFADGTEAAGRDAIATHYRDREGQGRPDLPHGALNTHLALSPVVTFDPDGTVVRGRWHELSMTGRFGAAAHWAGGIYENEYRQEDGAWKIARLDYFPSFRGDYSAGWRNADLSDKVTIVPFHYRPERAGTPVPQAYSPAAYPAPGEARRGGASAAEVARLGARVSQLEHEAAVLNLQHAWGFYFDRRMWDDVVDLFADDGTFELDGRGVFDGPRSIRRALDRIGPQGLRVGDLHDHPQLQVVVTVAPDGRTATARGTQVVMAGKNGGDSWWGVDLFENRFVRRDGQWRLKDVRIARRMRADYAKGWQASALPAPGPWAELAPDRPPTLKVAAYPEPQVPAIGFPHPSARVAPPHAARIGRGDDALVAAVDTAEVQLDRAIARDASENVSNAYGYYIDEFLWDETADLFSVDGSKELSFIGDYVGRERVRASLFARYGRNGRRAGFMAIHQKTQPVVHAAADGRSARIRSRLLQFNSQQKEPGSWTAGIYENGAVRENGVWKISRMDLDYTWNAGYVGGWARVAEAAPRQNPPPQISVAPDRPLRGAIQAPYPQVGTMAFHYANPVSGRAPPELLAP